MPSRYQASHLEPLPPSQPARERRTVELDIHGLLGVRLIDPSPSDVATVYRQLGVPQWTLEQEPDITLRFVKRLPAARLGYLGFAKKGFTDTAFFVFDGSRNKPVLAIPFDQMGKGCEILCESGLRSVPLLWPILALQALAKGYVAVHASACVYKGVGLLIAGWAETGKTTALLGFSSLGAEYIGDEWVLLSGDGERMYGLPKPIEMSPWHVESLPHVRPAIGRPRWCLVNTLRALARAQATILRKSSSATSPARICHRVVARLQRQVIPAVSPRTLFPDRVGSLVARPDKIFLLISHNDPRVRVEETPPSVMADRLANLAQHEQMQFLEHYLAFKFAFPGRKNAFLEMSSESRSHILAQALKQRETYTVWHPHPMVFSAFCEQIRPLCAPSEACAARVTYRENSPVAVY